MEAQAVLAVAREVIEWEARVLQAGASALDLAFVEAVQLILQRVPPGKVVVLGVGKSGHIGHKIAATLASTGTPAFFVHPTEAGHGDLGMIAPGDVVIAISYSGKSTELAAVMPYFRRNTIPVIAITGVADSPLGQSADLLLLANVEREACPLGLAPTASTTLTLALGDALAMCLLRCRGFTPEQFAATHPHGRLGRRLLVSVRDVMISGALLPKVSLDTPIRNCLREMSRGTIGVTAVVADDGALIGVFTDGDLRRVLELELDVLNLPVQAHMSRTPRTVFYHQLAVDAVQLMERFKINALLVLDDDGKLIGAVNMRIMLQAGVI